MRKYENLCAQEAYFDVYGVGPKSGLYYYGTYEGPIEDSVEKLARQIKFDLDRMKATGMSLKEEPTARWIGLAVLDEHGAEVAYASLNP